MSLLPFLLRGQDERTIKSPDGRIEFRLFVAQPDDGGLSQLAYQVWFQGKELLSTSWMGLDIYNQEPLLGQNLGLLHSSVTSGGSGDEKYNSLTAEYMQNGSLGRRLNVEVRAWNEGVAFRYVVPKSTPLDEILIHDEGTVFSFVHGVAVNKAGAEARFDLPFLVAEPGPGDVEIAEAGAGSFPRSYLAHVDGTSLIARLPRRPGDPNVAFEGPTPVALPWYVLLIGPDKGRQGKSSILRELNR